MMGLEELKKGFWGYKKESVYRYIVTMEENFSAKIAEKETRLTKLEAETSSRIAELERTLEALREENRALRENQASVFATLLEAQKHAERLKEETARRQREAQEDIRVAVQRQTQKLDLYTAKVQQLRQALQELLADFDGSAAEVERAMVVLQSEAPDGGLTVRTS